LSEPKKFSRLSLLSGLPTIGRLSLLELWRFEELGSIGERIFFITERAKDPPAAGRDTRRES
jgi:hypothetical protein